MNRFLPVLALAVATLSLPAAVEAVSVPPLIVPPERGPAKRIEALRTEAGTPAHAITLAPPSATELSALSSQRTGATAKRASPAGKRVPFKIGVVRDIDRRTRAIDTVALPWQTLPDGTRAARIDVSSGGAAGIRIGLALRGAAGVSVRFAGSAHPDDVFGPYSAAEIAAGDPYWSPILEGETGTMEIVLPAGVAPSSVELAIVKVGHLLVAGADLRTAGAMKWSIGDGVGKAGACEVDVSCDPPSAALTSVATSVALTVTTDARFVYQCTATLVNDSIASRTPYLYTANHCLASDPDSTPRSTPAQLAASMNMYFFFDAPACGSKSTPGYTLIGGGAALLARGDDYDWAIVRMNAAPPSSANFSAWRADRITVGTPVVAVHHPAGDVKKVSHGALSRYTTYDDGSSFATIAWSSGVTEQGSSGSPILTMSPQGFYEVRGGLYGGDSDCTNPSGTDDYSRLDIALPRITQYLTPDAANPAGIRPAVEFYHAGLNDYFITADPFEINCLDTGCHEGWERTGLRFLAYSNPALAPADATPVCRFYVLPAFGDSHFYSADPAECARTAAENQGSWVQESSAVFYIRLPDTVTGACPANTQPVYRFVNVATPLHHRYTPEVDVRNCLAYGMNSQSQVTDLNCTVPDAGVWKQEGYGVPPDAPVMCAPASN